MTKAMCAKIIFPGIDDRDRITLRQINAVHIESSWQELTDTAEIVLPRNVRFFDRKNVKKVFRRGDPVEIELGYDGDLKTEFCGYVKQVSANIPITISCEDEMFAIKPMPVNYSSPDAGLKDMLSELIPGYEMDVMEGVELGAVRFSRTSLGEVLQKLQQEMKLYTYFEPTTKKLIAGKIYTDNSDDTITDFDLERNVVGNNLDYKNADDLLVKVNGTAISKGVKLEYSYGDDHADKNIDWQFTVKTQSALEKQVQRFFAQNKQDGFAGSFVSYGLPSMQHGGKVHLTSALYADREGVYYVDGVKKSFSQNGYRQQINVGNQYDTGQ